MFDRLLRNLSIGWKLMLIYLTALVPVLFLVFVLVKAEMRLEGSRSELWIDLGVVSLLALLGFAAALILQRQINGSIHMLARGLGQLRKGETTIELPPPSRDEIGFVRDAVDGLRTDVADAFRLHQMVEDMPTTVITANAHDGFKINYANKAGVATALRIEKLLPVKAANLVGAPIDIFFGDSDAQCRTILSDPAKLPWKTRIKLGPETIEATAGAVTDKQGRYVGPMLALTIVTEQAELAEKVAEVAKMVSASAGDLRVTAQEMARTAEESSTQTATLAASADSASTNVQTVASAAEELSSSISEISRQVIQSSEIASQAVGEATQTNDTVKGLAEAAEKIGSVVQLINDIAGQTNLLALNATIEAARAGEAGKGFAVVANEVKSLANQTAKATEEISNQINTMQTVTGIVVEAIEGIGEIISRMNEITTSIASAVEEQGAATQEIARNVQQAAAGTSEVSSHITGVTESATKTGYAATELLEAAEQLAGRATQLLNDLAKSNATGRAA